MNWITLVLVATIMTVMLVSTEPSYATKEDNKIAKQLTLAEVFVTNNPSIKEVKTIDELTNLEQTIGIKVTEEEIAEKSNIVQELLKTYDDLLEPSVIAEIQNGDVEHAHNIVKTHTEKISDVLKITPSKSSQKDGIVGSVSNLNHFIPKQLNMLDIFG